MLYSRKLYYDFHRDLEHERDPVKKAAKYFYVIRAAFSGHFGAGFSTGPSPEGGYARKLWSALEDLKQIHRRLRNVVIEQLDFRECLKRYD
ncbi:MAG: hypothetical protein ACTSXC_08200 [Candidatus Freyarchaeota archaeon]